MRKAKLGIGGMEMLVVVLDEIVCATSVAPDYHHMLDDEDELIRRERKYIVVEKNNELRVVVVGPLLPYANSARYGHLDLLEEVEGVPRGGGTMTIWGMECIEFDAATPIEAGLLDKKLLQQAAPEIARKLGLEEAELLFPAW